MRTIETRGRSSIETYGMDAKIFNFVFHRIQYLFWKSSSSMKMVQIKKETLGFVRYHTTHFLFTFYKKREMSGTIFLDIKQTKKTILSRAFNKHFLRIL